MKKTVTILSMAAILATSAIAVEGKGYVGLGFGGSGLSDSDLVKDANIHDKKSKLDTSDVGFLAYGGYQFNKIVGVEAGYNNYGSFSAGDGEIKVSSASVSANLGYDFLDGQLRPFALIGLSYLMSDYYKSTYTDFDVSSVAFHSGLGVDYAPTMLKGVGFRFAWVNDIYNVKASKASGTPTNIKLEEKDYAQTAGLLYLGVDYNF